MAKFERVCKWCGTPFIAQRARGIFCTPACRLANHMQGIKDMTGFDDIPKEMPEKSGGVSGRGARAKGARGEREVCQLIAGITGDDVSRNIGQSRDGGHDVDWGPFAIEVKSQQTVSMPAWQSQVIRSVKGTDKIPTVAWRRKSEEWWIALPMSKFIEIFDMLRRAAEAGLKQNE
jgi:hypothetical protein